MDTGALEILRRARTALFVPGDRPERFVKAAASGADLVLLDLEDAVADPDKEAALLHILEALDPSAQQRLEAVVRINPAETSTHAQEVEALLGLAERGGSGLIGLMIPKSEDPEALTGLAARTAASGVGLILLIESAAGVLAAARLAAVPEVTRLAFGAVDYCLDIDADPELVAVLDHPRTQLVVASRVAGLPAPIDTPSTSIRDVDPVRDSARRGRRFGMGGKLCIHPAQLPAAAEAFAPSQREIDWARRVLAAIGGAAQVDGTMVDRPVQDRARRILDSAQAITAAPANANGTMRTKEEDA